MRSRRDLISLLEELLSITRGNVEVSNRKRWEEISAQVADARGTSDLEAARKIEHPEFIVVQSRDSRYRAVTTMYPTPASYLRVIETVSSEGPGSDRVEAKEIVYWDSVEWQEEDKDLSCIGAIFGVLNEVYRGEVIDIPIRRKRELE